MRNNKKTYNMVLTAIFGSIIFILGLVPNVGYIRILPGVAITIIHIPVIVAMFVLPLSGVLTLGFIFGLSSLIVAATQATQAIQPFDQAFIYPWISILPRMLFALVGYYILKLFKNMGKSNFSKALIFILISVISSFALYFGIQATVKNVTYNKVEIKQSELNKYKYSIDYDEDIYLNMETKYNELLAQTNLNYLKVKSVTTVILIVLIVLVVLTYFYLIYFSKYSRKYFYVPSVFILSTFLHTIFVIGAVVLFKPSIFYEMLGNDVNLISIILGIALTNGLIEAVFGALVGSPIVVAITNRLELE